MFLKLVRALIAYIMIIIVFCICFVPCFTIALLPARWRYDNHVYYWFVNLLYQTVVWSTFLPVTVKGKENIPHEPAIIVANHQSALDIPMLGAQLHGAPHFWLFLKRYAHYPIFGFIARRMNVVVDYSGWTRKIQALTTGLEWLKKYKSHLLIFPEGGRAIDGKIHDFYQGFAKMAETTGRPVVPVLMKNLNKVYPPGSFFVTIVPVTIIIGETFVFQNGESRDAFVQRVREWFLLHNT